MISTTWTKAPADLLGLGGLDVRRAYGPGLGLGTAVRVRPTARQAIGNDVITNSFQNNGTTLGIHSSGRPQS